MFSVSTALALKDDPKDKENKRHTMSHPPDHIPDLDSPRQSRSPIKKDKKERVSHVHLILSVVGKFSVSNFLYFPNFLRFCFPSFNSYAENQFRRQIKTS